MLFVISNHPEKLSDNKLFKVYVVSDVTLLVAEKSVDDVKFCLRRISQRTFPIAELADNEICPFIKSGSYVIRHTSVAEIKRIHPRCGVVARWNNSIMAWMEVL